MQGAPCRLFACATALLLAIVAGAAPAADLAAWQAGLARRAAEDGVLRLYAFPQADAILVRDLAARARAPFDELVVARASYFGNKDRDVPVWVDGRWPGKPALGIRTAADSVARTHFHRSGGDALSIALWLRTHAVPAAGERAVFAAVGDGTAQGWRLEATADGLALRLGRPAAAGGGVAVSVARHLDPHVWHLVVAVIDRQALRLHIDGAEAGSAAYAGAWEQPREPAGWRSAPELDLGGLRLGAGAGLASTLPFDVDEVAIHARALAPAAVAALYEEGRPERDAATQAADCRARERSEAARAAIRIGMDRSTFGYLPADREAVVEVAIPAAAQGLFADGEVVVRHSTEAQPSGAAAGGGEVRGGTGGVLRIPLGRRPCGLYRTTLAVGDRTGAVQRRATFDYAIRVPLPATADIDPGSMLSAYHCSRDETPSFGTRMMRAIQPIPALDGDGLPDMRVSIAFAEHCRARGMELLYCIQLPIAADGRTRAVADLDPGLRDFERHVERIVTALAGRVRHWEVLNEPNSGHDRGLTAERYVDLLRIAHRVIKRADPAAVVVGCCGTSAYERWIEAVLAAGGGAFLDIISFHNYLGTSPIASRADPGRIAAVRRSCLRHLGRVPPLWNSECGIHMPPRVDGRPATEADLIRLFPTRSTRNEHGLATLVDSVMMVDEPRSARWQAQSLLLEAAAGVERYFLLMHPSQSYPEAGSYPMTTGAFEQVSEKGVALAAVQSVLCRARRVDEVATGVGAAAAVLVEDRDGARTAAFFADQPCRLAFTGAAPPGTRLHGMDHLGNPLEAAVDADGVLVVEADSGPLYLFQVGAGLAALGVVAMEPSALAAGPATGADTVIPLALRNPLPRPIDLRLAATSSAGAVACVPERLALAPGASAAASLRWASGDLPKGRHRILVEARDGDRPLGTAGLAGLRVAGAGRVRGIPAAPAAPPSCGPDGMWLGIQSETAADATCVVRGRPIEGATDPAWWAGPEDLSFTAATTWDADGLAVCVAVRDDRLRVPPGDQAAPWRFDCVELFIDARAEGLGDGTDGPGVWQVLVSPVASPTAAPVRVVLAKGDPAGLRGAFTARTTSQGYVIQGRIDLPQVAMQRGRRLRLDVAVDDNDAPPGVAEAKAQMALHGGEDNYKSAAAWGRYILK